MSLLGEIVNCKSVKYHSDIKVIKATKGNKVFLLNDKGCLEILNSLPEAIKNLQNCSVMNRSIENSKLEINIKKIEIADKLAKGVENLKLISFNGDYFLEEDFEQTFLKKYFAVKNMESFLKHEIQGT